MNKKKRIAVIGTGLWGLLTGIALSNKETEVEIFGTESPLPDRIVKDFFIDLRLAKAVPDKSFFRYLLRILQREPAFGGHSALKSGLSTNDSVDDLPLSGYKRDMFGRFFDEVFLGHEKAGNLVVEYSKAFSKLRATCWGCSEAEHGSRDNSGLANKISTTIHHGLRFGRLKPLQDSFQLTYFKEGIGHTRLFDQVVLTEMDVQPSSLLSFFGSEIAGKLEGVNHKSIKQVVSSYDPNELKEGRNIPGFWSAEKDALGIWGSILHADFFPTGEKADEMIFSTFVEQLDFLSGLWKGKQSEADSVIDKWRGLLGIESNPQRVQTKTWEKAITIKDEHFTLLQRTLDQLESDFPGLFFSGTYRGGSALKPEQFIALARPGVKNRHCCIPA